MPKKAKGKQGGQKGHKGRTLRQVEHPDKTVKCNPGACDCGHVFENDELVLSEKRQVFDFPQPELEVIEYQIQKGKCPVCGKWHKGIAPEGVNAPVQYGNGVKAYAVLLNVHFKLPFKKIQLLSGCIQHLHRFLPICLCMQNEELLRLEVTNQYWTKLKAGWSMIVGAAISTLIK